MNQIFLASTLFGAMNLAAAIEQGLFGDSNDHTRTLLVSTNSVIPEVTTPLSGMSGAEAVLTHFDHVVDWNEALAPFHPSTFTEIGEPIVTSRWLRGHLGIDDGPIELVLESIQVPPARTLAAVFRESAITVYSDGLMSYGPTRVRLPMHHGERIQRLIHLDLVPGLEPVLLSEFDVEIVPIDDHHFRRVIDEVVAQTSLDSVQLDELPDGSGTALILGQYLAALQLMSEDEEIALYAEMIRRASKSGYSSVVFKPHPTAPSSTRDELAAVAHECGVGYTALDLPVNVEILLAKWTPALVTGCFSTGMFIAHRFFDIEVAAFGTRAMLKRLSPFENSNRIPLVITDAWVPSLTGSTPGDNDVSSPAACPKQADLTQLVGAVAYLMQPQIRHSDRVEVATFLLHSDPSLVGRYFDQRRIESLDLPGSQQSMRRRTKSVLKVGYREASVKARRYPRLAGNYRRARRRMAPKVLLVARHFPASPHDDQVNREW